MPVPRHKRYCHGWSGEKWNNSLTDGTCRVTNSRAIAMPVMYQSVLFGILMMEKMLFVQ